MGGNTLRVVVANEPRAYREAIAQALRGLRPHMDVIVVEADALDDAARRFPPHLIVCVSATATVRAWTLAWVELYPDGRAHAVISVDGERSTVHGIGLADLLSLVDETERLAQLS